MEDALQKWKEFKRNLELISSQEKPHIEMPKTQPKKQKIQVRTRQTHVQGEPAKEIPMPFLLIFKQEQAPVQNISTQ